MLENDILARRKDLEYQLEKEKSEIMAERRQTIIDYFAGAIPRGTTYIDSNTGIYLSTPIYVLRHAMPDLSREQILHCLYDIFESDLIHQLYLTHRTPVEDDFIAPLSRSYFSRSRFSFEVLARTFELIDWKRASFLSKKRAMNSQNSNGAASFT